MTTVTSYNSGARIFWIQPSKASPSIASLMTHGTIRLSCIKPAMNVCVPHAPNWASISSRFLHKLRPYWRVKLVFTDVTSMKTSRSGCACMAGRWCLNQSWRRFLTWAHSRSVANSNLFICVTGLAQEPDKDESQIRPFGNPTIHVSSSALQLYLKQGHMPDKKHILAVAVIQLCLVRLSKSQNFPIQQLKVSCCYLSEKFKFHHFNYAMLCF